MFAGFTAAKKTIQNWITPHICAKTYWIHSLLRIVTCECTTALNLVPLMNGNVFYFQHIGLYKEHINP